ncbi:YggT family protein [Oceanospirillum multiglobuliferum]|uniref:YggT family protein n=1 Tax=Oceanospirillum multiglobuliferum TaxID=64969 RepID=A0A1T4SMD8_9GAMM|nr:YggT family protein [Oceanospirillum multiglobuliferum]OPX54178.1 YggT family protein [Oceanospirillum multiglobuliferum]SKA29357.1 YggT family protein [Oceanospirillum multiglobuliferum]
MGQSVGSAGVYLVSTLVNLYLFIVMLRFVLQYSKADFYNPISQAVARATFPLVRPLQTVLRPMGRIDLATLLLAVLVKAAGLILVLQIAGAGFPPIVSLVIGSLAGAISTLLNIYFFALLASIILSWVAPQSGHPGAMLVYQITEPVMSPVRNMLPSLGGIDLSPIFVFIGINVLEMIVVGPLVQMSGLPMRLVSGL